VEEAMAATDDHRTPVPDRARRGRAPPRPAGCSKKSRRLGRDPDTDLLPRLIFHASRAVTASAVELLVHGTEPPRTPVRLSAKGFRSCATAFTRPAVR
jgi:hypothetical protein